MKSASDGKGKARGTGGQDDLPPQLEYLRSAALEFVGSDREIVGCGQVDFNRLERAIRAETAGLSAKDAAAKKSAQGKLLREWLERHEASDEPLAIGLRFVAMLLE
jgi:hypothetical protein